MSWDQLPTENSADCSMSRSSTRSLAPYYLNQAVDRPADELADALEAFRPAGSVLELACGPGLQTSQPLCGTRRTLRRWTRPRKMLAIVASWMGDDWVRRRCLRGLHLRQGAGPPLGCT